MWSTSDVGGLPKLAPPCGNRSGGFPRPVKAGAARHHCGSAAHLNQPTCTAHPSQAEAVAVSTFRELTFRTSPQAWAAVAMSNVVNVHMYRNRGISSETEEMQRRRDATRCRRDHHAQQGSPRSATDLCLERLLRRRGLVSKLIDV